MPRKAKAKSAVRLPLALGCLALLAMTALRPAPSSWSLLRAGRRLSTAVDVERDENGKALPLGISSAVADRVRHLGEPLYADEANIFAFDETDSRPITSTCMYNYSSTTLVVGVRASYAHKCLNSSTVRIFIYF